MSFSQIAIDLDVYKALEALRNSFDEPHNAILRRILKVHGAAPVERPPERERLSRTSGEYELSVLGKMVRVRSLREALSTALERIEATQPGFLEKLAAHRTPRGRRIIGHKPEDIYPDKPQLQQYAVRLNSRWWFDTNISRKACERYLVILGLIANVEAPRLS